jgi:16S rRNA (guanine527-N7)-methyltransferase
VTVHRGRAEEMHGETEWSEGFDVVTSRAVAPMDRLAGWSLPLVRSGGLFLAMKGSSAQDELDRAAKALRRLGGVDAHVETVGEQWLAPPVTVVSVRAR